MAVEIRTSWILAAVLVTGGTVVAWRTIERQDVDWFFTRVPATAEGEGVEPSPPVVLPETRPAPPPPAVEQPPAPPEPEAPPPTVPAPAPPIFVEGTAWAGGIPDSSEELRRRAREANRETQPQPGDMEARVLSRALATYPPEAARAHIEGSVDVEATIGADGRVRTVRALSGHPWLVPAAIEAMRQWRYEPAVRGGAPVESVARVRFTFQRQR